MPVAKINGLKVVYQRTGTGAPMLFIGGTGWDMRQHPNPRDSILAQQFDFVHYDQRGMGQSDKPPGPYKMVQFATDAVALADGLAWERVHIVGYSFGGMVAQEIAIRWPDKVRSLVLCATTAGGAGGSSYAIEKFLALDPIERARKGLEVADKRFTADWQAANPDEAAEMISRRMKRQTQFVDHPGVHEGLVAQLHARAAHNTFDRLEQITAPTLVLVGEHDGQAPRGAQESMAARIRQCSLQVLPGSHNFVFESDAAYHAIAEFCDTVKN